MIFMPVLADLLGKRLSITIKDKRSFIGYFQCIDREQNLILSQTYQEQAQSLMGTVIIQGKDIESIYLTP